MSQTTSETLAKFFDRSEATIKRWIREHQVPYYAARNHYIVGADAVELLQKALVVSAEEKRARRTTAKEDKAKREIAKKRSEIAKAAWNKRKNEKPKSAIKETKAG